jgi:HPt (histidine-containing phosphotransfer) domain-containing protein
LVEQTEEAAPPPRAGTEQPEPTSQAPLPAVELPEARSETFSEPEAQSETPSEVIESETVVEAVADVPAFVAQVEPPAAEPAPIKLAELALETQAILEPPPAEPTLPVAPATVIGWEEPLADARVPETPIAEITAPAEAVDPAADHYPAVGWELPEASQREPVVEPVGSEVPRSLVDQEPLIEAQATEELARSLAGEVVESTVDQPAILAEAEHPVVARGLEGLDLDAPPVQPAALEPIAVEPADDLVLEAAHQSEQAHPFVDFTTNGIEHSDPAVIESVELAGTTGSLDVASDHIPDFEPTAEPVPALEPEAALEVVAEPRVEQEQVGLQPAIEDPVGDQAVIGEAPVSDAPQLAEPELEPEPFALEIIESEEPVEQPIAASANQPAPEPLAEPILTPQVAAQIANGGGFGLQHLVATFVRDTPARLADVMMASARGDVARLGLSLGQVEELARLIGAERLAELSVRAGKAVSEGSAQQAVALLGRIEQAFLEVRELIQNLAPPSLVPDAELPSVNSVFIQQLSPSRDGAARALAARLVDSFRTDGPARLTDLRQAVEREDCDAGQRLAQTLKGMCGLIGAEPMAKLCALVEADARLKRIGQSRRNLEQLRLELDRVVATLEKARA